MKFVPLKKLDVTMAWRWLKQLGSTCGKNEKCCYTDGHEKGKNARCRLKFIIKRYFEHELCTFHWVQELTEDEATSLEQLEKNPSKQGLAAHSYANSTGEQMREHHVDCQDGLCNFIDPENAIFGGNLSVQFPEGMQPLVVVGQDEMITYQFLFAAKSWKSQQGKTLILPRGDGEGIMVSASILRELGLGPELTDDQLPEIIRRFRTGKEEHVSKEDTIGLFGTAENQAITRRKFAKDPVDSTFLKMFRHSQAHNGCWTHRHVKIQIEDLVDCLKVIFPNFGFLLLFDQSSGHTKKRGRVEHDQHESRAWREGAPHASKRPRRQMPW
jgi:hypothetical protein